MEVRRVRTKILIGLSDKPSDLLLIWKLLLDTSSCETLLDCNMFSSTHMNFHQGKGALWSNESFSGFFWLDCSSVLLINDVHLSVCTFVCLPSTYRLTIAFKFWKLLCNPSLLSLEVSCLLLCFQIHVSGRKLVASFHIKSYRLIRFKISKHTWKAQL